MRRSHWDEIAFVGGFVGIIMTLATVALVLFLVAYMVVAALRHRRESQQDPKAPKSVTRLSAVHRKPAEGESPPLPDPDALAREGRFAEAIHALLMHAFDRIVRNSHRPPPAAATSRELLRSVPLSDDGRAALRLLVTGTERAVFAQESVVVADFERCRAALNRLDAAP